MQWLCQTDLMRQICCWRGYRKKPWKDLRGDHRQRDGRVSSIARAHYHVCVGSERDDSVYASCRREQWSAELHIDFWAVRGALVLTLTLSRALSTYLARFQLDACGSLFFRLSHKPRINVSFTSGISHFELFHTKDTNDAHSRPPCLLHVTVHWHHLGCWQGALSKKIQTVT